MNNKEINTESHDLPSDTLEIEQLMDRVAEAWREKNKTTDRINKEKYHHIANRFRELARYEVNLYGTRRRIFGLDLKDIADLVDRQTCEIVHDDDSGYDTCTNCGTVFFVAEADLAKSPLREAFNFCPLCGAEVVE